MHVVDTVAPILIENWPAEQLVQLEAPVDDRYCPATHSEQELNPAIDVNWPLAHEMHAFELAAPVELRNLPAAQLEHAEEPVSMTNFPKGHCWQAVAFDMPETAKKVPASHATQVIAP